MMLPSRGPGRRAVVGAVGAVALAGAMFVGSAAAASAEPPTPPPPAPPNCSPADWAGVRAGVAAATSAYLFTHPPVNDFFATLTGQSRDEMRPQVQAYLDANPQVRADLEGIKQPAVDFLDRCSYVESIRHSVTATTLQRFRCSAGCADERLLECRRPPTHFASRARRCD